MVGSAVLKLLRKQGYSQLLTATRNECNLLSREQTENFFTRHKPGYVFLSAAKVGGIRANNEHPAEFIYDNIMIAANTIDLAWRNKVERLLFFGSSCIYPKHAKQPISEDRLLTGALEITNKPYAVAKIAGLNLCEAYNRQYGTDFRMLMPTNVYGCGDNFHPQNSHVLAALLLKLHRAKEQKLPSLTLWGSGEALREFIHVDDLADAALHVMTRPPAKVHREGRIDEQLNVGTGKELSIKALADLIKEVVGYRGDIQWDTTMPDGTPRKLLDITRLKELGWEPRIALRDGICQTYEWFLENEDNLRAV